MLYKYGYVVMFYSFVYVFNSKTNQNQNLKQFSHRITEYALISIHQVTARSSFTANLSLRMTSVYGSKKKSGASNVSVYEMSPNSRRSNIHAPFRTSEKSVTIVTDMTKLFPPPGSDLLTDHGGMMTAHLADMDPKFECECIPTERN